MKFGINQSISQTITQLACIQLETPSSRLWNFWWIKTYTTFKMMVHIWITNILQLTGNLPAAEVVQGDCKRVYASYTKMNHSWVTKPWHQRLTPNVQIKCIILGHWPCTHMWTSFTHRYWPYLAVCKYRKEKTVPMNSRKWPTWLPSIGTDSSVTMNHKNGLNGA